MKRVVKVWLWIGVVMVFVQIILGGVTRLTGSGLSITKWEIVTGTIPPLNAAAWNAEFDKYKQTPQYIQINQGMSLAEFKYIYFWEYLHRVWARTLGLVFVFPFFWFLYRGYLSRKLIRQLGIAVLLGVLVATFGWIMVASGLVSRPWVNAYKLTIHLNLGLLLYVWLLRVALGEQKYDINSRLRSWVVLIAGILVVQLILGGLMSGMKAAVYYPTWPDMHGAFFPTALLNADLWNMESVIHYERGLIPGIVQFLHRMVAYVLVVIVCIYIRSAHRKITELRKINTGLLVVIILQVILGIITVIKSQGQVPVVYGVLHQGMAIVVLSFIVVLLMKIRR